MRKIVLFLTLVFAFNCSLVAAEDFKNLEGQSVDDALNELGSNDNYDNWDERDVPMMGDPDYEARVYWKGEYHDEAPALPRIAIPRMRFLLAQANERRARREERRNARRERRQENVFPVYVTWAK